MAVTLIPGNLLTLNQQSIETDATGWTANINCAVAATAAQANDGVNSLSLTSTAAGDMWTFSAGAQFAVVAGLVYNLSAYVRAAVSARSCGFKVDFYTAGSVFIGSTPEFFVTNSTAAWTQITSGQLGCEAPPTAAAAAVTQHVVGAGAASEVHYWDTMSVVQAGSTTAFHNNGWW